MAQMFVASPDNPTPGSELLDSSKLDFSLESLGVVNQHLEVMRQKNLDGELFIKFIFRCGAYVGEVIRRNAKDKKYHWLDYKEAAKLNKTVAGLKEDLGTVVILWDSKDGFSFPFGKVIKYLQNGSEDSVKFFAQFLISGQMKRN